MKRNENVCPDCLNSASIISCGGCGRGLCGCPIKHMADRCPKQNQGDPVDAVLRDGLALKFVSAGKDNRDWVCVSSSTLDKFLKSLSRLSAIRARKPRRAK